MAYADPEEKKRKAKEYYEKNKERIIERQLKRYNEKKESIMEQQKEYVKENKDMIRLRQNEWRHQNKEKIAEQNKKAKAKRQATSKEYRKTNAEKAREWRNKQRLELINAYGGKCTCCGETEPTFLTIDHKNGGGNKHRKNIGGYGSGGTSFYNWLKIQGYPKEDYELLCWNCNCGRSKSPDNICPHERERMEMKK
jgi:hypothetical protein